MPARTLCLVGHPAAPIDALFAYLEPLARDLSASADIDVRVTDAAVDGFKSIHLRHAAASAFGLLRGVGAADAACVPADTAERGRRGLGAIDFELALGDPSHAVARLAELLEVPVPAPVLRRAVAAHAAFRAAALPYAHPAAFVRSVGAAPRAILSPGTEYPTARGKAASAALIAGWQGAEEWGVWSRGRHAALGLLIAAQGNGGGYRLRCRCMVKPDIGLSVTVDGEPADHTFIDGSETFIEVALGPGRPGRDGTHFLVGLDIARPVRAAPDDAREVAVGLKSVRVDPAAPAPSRARVVPDPMVAGFAPAPLPLPDGPAAPLDPPATGGTVLALGARAGTLALAAVPDATIFGTAWASDEAASPVPAPRGRVMHRDGPAADAIAAAEHAGLRLDGFVIDGLGALGLDHDAVRRLLALRLPGAAILGREPTPSALATTLMKVAPVFRAAGMEVTVEGRWWRATSLDDRAEHDWLAAGTA